MLTIEKCKKILKIEDKEISDDVISEIRNMLYTIAEIAVETIIFKENQNENSSNDEPRQLG
jgi:hypothetical protein